MKSPKAPTPPDPVATASTQAAANVGTASATQAMNMIDQYSPNGSLTYNKIGETVIPNGLGGTMTVPRYSATTSLSQQQQRLYDLNNQTDQNLAQIGATQSSKIGDILGTAFSMDGAPSRMSTTGIKNPTMQRVGDGPQLATDYGSTDYEGARKSVEDALYSRLNPQLDRARTTRETQLTSQGLRPGTAAWTNAMNDVSRTENDARLAVVGAGGAEQSRLAGLAQQAATFGNDARQQMFSNQITGAGFNNQAGTQELANATSLWNLTNADRNAYMQEGLTLRQLPLNEINALMSGAQVQNPSFVNTPNVQVGGVDYQGAVQNQFAGQMDAYKSKLASSQAAMGGLFSLGSSVAGLGAKGFFSDRRLKTDVQRVGTWVNGLPVYTFRYKWGGPEQIGFMSDEVRALHPEAVVVVAGYDMVDYGRAVL